MKAVFGVILALFLGGAGQCCHAQAYSSTGSSWSSSWGYATAADRSLGLATAQAIAAKRVEPQAPIYNTWNTTNTTSSVGSMNTGTTNIEVTGDQNTVSATNSADNTGCVDGSLSTSTVEGVNAFPLGPLDLSALGLGATAACPG
ncbi:hypothetical protein NX862_17420 [Rhodobacter sp. KR11]|uniref:hypothetical protein n=1 Tax=Rhodobacter sp. KR11 TaxID=2974588 RepID=UPI002221A703|nr:hypothetical protein [Rhodobacter sp. KR11]MCW1920541.1 hypothetical protein [Rhodobacter sp. KR11]